MVYQDGEAGRRKINQLFKADFFGERALLSDEPRCGRQAAGRGRACGAVSSGWASWLANGCAVARLPFPSSGCGSGCCRDAAAVLLQWQSCGV